MAVSEFLSAENICGFSVGFFSLGVISLLMSNKCLSSIILAQL